jgi:hypothetical protein
MRATQRRTFVAQQFAQHIFGHTARVIRYLPLAIGMHTRPVNNVCANGSAHTPAALALLALLEGQRRLTNVAAFVERARRAVRGPLVWNSMEHTTGARRFGRDRAGHQGAACNVLIDDQ